MNIGWPEGIAIGLYIVTLSFYAYKNGEPKDEKYNFPMAFVRVLTSIGLLWWGGFWS